jgi:hypothetical protein
LTYFHFFIGDREVSLHVTGPDGAAPEQAKAALNFEDTLFSALNVLHRLMASGGGHGSYHPNRAFIRKIGRIQASLLNITVTDPARPTDVQVLFEKHWKLLANDTQARACFSFDFAQQPPYTELAELPWEFLSYQNLDLALGTAPSCDFVRKIQQPAPPPPPAQVPVAEALRVLLLIGEPDLDALRRADQPLVAYRESYVYRLLRVYENLANAQAGRLHLRVLFQPRRAEIQQAQPQRRAVVFDEFLDRFQKNMVEPDGDPIRSRDNQDFQPHVVHFFGHVAMDERDEETVACINDEGGLDFVPCQAFAACFAAAPPSLFILQAPEGVQLHRGPFSQSGLLADLAQKRVPYILSFQHPVGEQGSLAFLRDLYQRLFDAQSVPVAVTAARARLNRDTGSLADLHAFGSPALYTTLAQPLYLGLLSNIQSVASDTDSAGAVATMSLAEKIAWYGTEIRRLVEHSELEAALEKYREIVHIAIRSPDSNVALAESYQDEMSSLFMRFNDAKISQQRGDITIAERSRQYQSVGNALLDNFKPNRFPGITQKTPADKPAANTPRLR